MTTTYYPLNPAHAALLRESVAQFQGKGSQLASKMFDFFFQAHPELISYFSSSFFHYGSFMSRTVAHMVFQLVLQVEQLDRFEENIDQIAHKHTSRGIKAEHYPMLAEALLKAIQEVINPKQEVLEAWRAAYDSVAAKMINREAEIAERIKQEAWEGFQTFRIAAIKIEETDRFTSEVFSDAERDGGEHASDSDDSADNDDNDDSSNNDENNDSMNESVGASCKSKLCDIDDERPKRYLFFLEPLDDIKTKIPVHQLGQHICIRFKIGGLVSHRNYSVAAIDNGKIVVSTDCFFSDNTATSDFMRSQWEKGNEVEISAPLRSFLMLELLEVN